jgi:hypothetical protein
MYNKQTPRDTLMVVAGVTAAYMNASDTIDILQGPKHEETFAEFIIETVDTYLSSPIEAEFNSYIQTALLSEYGVDGG